VSLFYLGLTYEQDGQPDAAMERYLRGLALAEKDGDIILESYLRRHIGGIQEERGELASAGKNIDLEIALRKKGGFVVGIPFALRQKADFVLAHGAGRAEAIKILEEAISIAQSCGSTRGLYLARVDLSRLALEAGDQARAIRLAEQALEAARAFGGAPALREAAAQLDAARKGPVGTR
jgi:tetratricopeptide (TPR) repeat protein